MRKLMVYATALVLGAAACGDDDGGIGVVRVASLELTPDSARAGAVLLVGDTLTLTATPKDASGNALVGRVVSFFSSNEGIARVTSDGRVIGVGEGQATITARSENDRQATASVTVVKPYTLVSVGGQQLPVTIQGPQGPLTLNSGAVALYTSNGRFFLRLRYATGNPLIESGTYTSAANGALTFTSSVTPGVTFQGTQSGNTITFNFGTPAQPELCVFTR